MKGENAKSPALEGERVRCLACESSTCADRSTRTHETAPHEHRGTSEDNWLQCGNPACASTFCSTRCNTTSSSRTDRQRWTPCCGNRRMANLPRGVCTRRLGRCVIPCRRRIYPRPCGILASHPQPGHSQSETERPTIPIRRVAQFLGVQLRTTPSAAQRRQQRLAVPRCLRTQLVWFVLVSWAFQE